MSSHQLSSHGLITRLYSLFLKIPRNCDLNSKFARTTDPQNVNFPNLLWWQFDLTHSFDKTKCSFLAMWCCAYVQVNLEVILKIGAHL